MSNFIVSARKYRPKRFAEVVGQGHIVATLENSLNKDKLAHALLFCGPRGVGKTTCARILARALNCTDLQNGSDPCGKCEACMAFERNASFNIFELDAASYNGVEHIRTLNDQVRVPPSVGQYKVYIIDEVHMLSVSAFNAFLKTLEEPPPYAVFILATTEKHKILPTILSRCQIFDFRRIQVKDIAEHLEKIAEQEQITAEYDALITIAEKADGALRDALSLFDRIANVTDREITYRSVVENLNLLDYDVFFKAADACLREDMREVLLIFDEVLRNGFEGDVFMDGLAAHYRDLLVCKNPKTLKLLDHSETLKDRYHNQAQLMSEPYIFSALNIINEADIHYPEVRNKRLHVEMALVKICFLNRKTTGSPFVPEKKTHDASTNVTTEAPTIAKAGYPEKNEPTPVRKEPAKVETDEPEQPVETEVTTNAAAKAEQKPSGQAKPTTQAPVRKEPVQSQPFRRLKGAIPQIKSLDELESEIVESEKLARENSLDLTLQNLESWWSDYREKINSPVTVSALKSTTLSINGKEVMIEVASLVTKTRIQELNTLLSDLRQAFGDQELQLRIEVNIPEGAEENNKPKKLLTNKEKYELLTSKNPDVENLRQSLDLIVDHDE